MFLQDSLVLVRTVRLYLKQIAVEETPRLLVSSIYSSAFTTTSSKSENAFNLTFTPGWWPARTEHICHYGLVQHSYKMKHLIDICCLGRLGNCCPKRLGYAFCNRHKITAPSCTSSCTRWASTTTATSRPKTALFFPGIALHALPYPVHYR